MSEIKLHAQTWNNLSQQDRTKVEEILKGTGLLKSDDVLKADPATQQGAMEASLTNPWCTAACSVAEAAAVAACAPTGALAPACIAAAHAAAEYCRSRC